jgi:ketosteroid isomerase-like protein
MEIWELAAREEIRDLVARYNAQGDAGRIDAMLELFCEDAVLELEGRSYCGVEAMRRCFAAVAGGTRSGGARYIRHFTATHQIDLESETRAWGRCYYQTLTERGLDHWGRYLDEYRRVAERWRFQRRKVSVDGQVEGGWAAQTRSRLPPG